MQRIDCGGKFTYVFTPYAQPIAEVEDGETFEVVTEDAFVGALNSEEQNPEAIVPINGIGGKCSSGFFLQMYSPSL